LDHIFDPRSERDACGIGFIANADGSSARSVVEAALEALFRVRHRGAIASDALTGDGAGVLAPIPSGIFGGRGVAMVFARSDSYHAIVEEAAEAEGLTDLEWRDVPINENALGALAQSTAPRIVQLLFSTDIDDSDERERACFRARRRAERLARERGVDLYVPSWSFRTVTYKALVSAPFLAEFYKDLADPDFAASFAVFHQRYATNTRPTWERAQPFRFQIGRASCRERV